MEEKPIHMKLAVDPFLGETGVSEFVVAAAEQKGLFIQAYRSPYDWGEVYEGVNAVHSNRSLFTLELQASFFLADNAGQIATVFPALVDGLLNRFGDVFEQKTSSYEKVVHSDLQLIELCVYYLDETRRIQFAFDLSLAPKQLLQAWKQMIDILEKLRFKDSDTLAWLDQKRRQKNNMAFLQFSGSQPEWKVVDRLADATYRLSVEYQQEVNDNRVRKPYIVFNEENFDQYEYFDNQWTLMLDEEIIILPQPNDISLYIRLMEASLKKAEIFYQSEMDKRVGKPHMPILNTEEYLAYYDYFESMIAAVIFSYTAIETLANIAIPEDFVYVRPGTGKDQGMNRHYSKAAIERILSLKEKLSEILPQVIQSPKPTQEPWWEDFVALEKLRNEVIHTKQSKSEERYSLLLTPQIFELVRCSKAIISFYGVFIAEHQPILLFDFPYDFGQDNVPPSFMSKQDFEEHYKHLHNPWKPDGEKTERPLDRK